MDYFPMIIQEVYKILFLLVPVLVSVAMRVVIHLASAAFASLSAGIVGKKGTLLVHAGV